MAVASNLKIILCASSKILFLLYSPKLQELKEQVNLPLESMRNKGEIGSSLGAKVIIRHNNNKWFNEMTTSQLERLFIVSQVEVVNDPSIEKIDLKARKADGIKCTRCWRYETSVGAFANHPEICDRCYDVVINLSEAKPL